MHNQDQRDFWTNQAGPVWVRRADAMDHALAPVLDALLEAAALEKGEHVLDIGCGAGTSTREAADRVGPNGKVMGVDISSTLLDAAKARAVPNTEFLLADAQTHEFEPASFDAMISRFGVMFFDDSVAAFRHLNDALKPSGRLAFASWGAIPENPFFTLPARVAKSVLGPIPKSDPDAPGPFALRDPNYIKKTLHASGFKEIHVKDTPITLTPKGSIKEVVSLMLDIGPAHAALVHHKSSDVDRLRLKNALTDALEIYATPEGIRIPSRINIVTARKPA